MIVISILACMSALGIMYFFLRKNIFVYQEKQKNSIMDEIHKEMREIDEIQKRMLRSSRELNNVQYQETVTKNNIDMMKKNNYQAILNRKEKLRKQYETIYERKLDAVRQDVIESVLLDILKNIDHSDHELIDNIRHIIEQL